MELHFHALLEKIPTLASLVLTEFIQMGYTLRMVMKLKPTKLSPFPTKAAYTHYGCVPVGPIRQRVASAPMRQLNKRM